MVQGAVCYRPLTPLSNTGPHQCLPRAPAPVPLARRFILVPPHRRLFPLDRLGAPLPLRIARKLARTPARLSRREHAPQAPLFSARRARSRIRSGNWSRQQRLAPPVARLARLSRGPGPRVGPARGPLAPAVPHRRGAAHRDGGRARRGGRAHARGRRDPEGTEAAAGSRLACGREGEGGARAGEEGEGGGGDQDLRGGCGGGGRGGREGEEAQGAAGGGKKVRRAGEGGERRDGPVWRHAQGVPLACVAFGVARSSVLSSA